VEFITSFVSEPVKHATPMTHSVFRNAAPRSRKFSALRGMFTPGNPGSTGGRVIFPENVLTEALGSSEVRVAMNLVAPVIWGSVSCLFV